MLARLERIVGRSLPVVELDCRDTPALRRALCEVDDCFGVIHFAAHKAVGASVAEAVPYYDNNVGSLTSLLTAMGEVGIENLVYSSSATVYGEADELPVTERSPTKPAESPYGRTKQVCELVLNDAAASALPLRAVTLRYFNPVGAHPSGLIGELPLGKPENLVPFITQTAAGLRPELTVFGNDYPTPDGTCTRDYIHVVDLARAHVAALDWLSREQRSAFNEIFNVGTGSATSVLQAIAAFEQASGTSLSYRIGPRRPGDIVESYASVDKARELLGWQAELTILDAMRDAWRWQLALKENPL
jgi:UDP-glucose 4-epimerase